MERLGTAVLRTRMAGGVGGAGSNPAPTRLCSYLEVRHSGVEPWTLLGATVFELIWIVPSL